LYGQARLGIIERRVMVALRRTITGLKEIARPILEGMSTLDHADIQHNRDFKKFPQDREGITIKMPRAKLAFF
jgi:hypothetical protein